MDANTYRKAFLELVGVEPTDEFLKWVEAAEAAAALAGIYSRCYGEERGRRKACAVVYRRMRQCWKMQK